jgi:hypothetical protein
MSILYVYTQYNYGENQDEPVLSFRNPDTLVDTDDRDELKSYNCIGQIQIKPLSSK